MTYGYVTKAAVEGLLKSAEITTTRGGLSSLPPVNFTTIMELGDQPPARVRESDIALVGKSFIYATTFSLSNVFPR
jgi:hypothetical protein